MKKNQKIKKILLNVNVVFTEEADGGYSIMVPSLPGCFSQGGDFEEGVRNIKEAISLYLEDDAEAPPLPRREFMAPVTL